MALFNLETLDSLIEYNTRFALDIYEKNKSIDNLVIGYTPDNTQQLFFHGDFRNHTEKMEFIDLIKVSFIAYNIDKYVVITEAWFVESKSKEECEKCSDLSKHPNRSEGIIITAINKIGTKIKIFKITKDKKLQACKEINGNCAGRFTDFLPKQKIPEEKRKKLIELLSQYGCSISNVGAM